MFQQMGAFNSTALNAGYDNGLNAAPLQRVSVSTSINELDGRLSSAASHLETLVARFRPGVVNGAVGNAPAAVPNGIHESLDAALEKLARIEGAVSDLLNLI